MQETFLFHLAIFKSSGNLKFYFIYVNKVKVITEDTNKVYLCAECFDNYLVPLFGKGHVIS